MPKGPLTPISYRKFDSNICSMICNQNGVLSLGLRDGSVQFHTPSTFIHGMQMIKEFKKIHNDSVSSLALLDENTLWSGDGDGNIKIIDIPSGTVKGEGKCYGWIRSMLVLTGSKFTNHILIGTSGSVELWNAESMSRIKKFNGINHGFSLVQLDESRVAVGGEKWITILDLESGQVLNTMEADSYVYSIVFDGKHIYGLSCNGTLYVMDAGSASLIKSKKIHPESDPWCYRNSILYIAGPNPLLITTGGNSSTLITNPETLEPIAKLHVPGERLLFSDNTLYLSHHSHLYSFSFTIHPHS